MRIMHDAAGVLHYTLDNEEVKFLGDLVRALRCVFPTGGNLASALTEVKTMPRRVDLGKLEADVVMLKSRLDAGATLSEMMPSQLAELRSSVEALNQRLYELNSEYGAF